jgi:hypothetical protein
MSLLMPETSHPLPDTNSRLLPSLRSSSRQFQYDWYQDAPVAKSVPLDPLAVPGVVSHLQLTQEEIDAAIAAAWPLSSASTHEEGAVLTKPVPCNQPGAAVLEAATVRRPTRL